MQKDTTVMAKSKVRKNRRQGPARTLDELATARASKNFITMVTEKATEGKGHQVYLHTADGEVGTAVVTGEGKPHIEDPTVSELIITALAMDEQVAIVVDTLGEDGKTYTRTWLAEDGRLKPAPGQLAKAAARDTALQNGDDWEDDENHIFLDAYRLI